MVRKHFIIFGLGTILASCAQVGVITGGDKDTSAPKPVMDKVEPPSESINFTGNEVTIPFDEYFSLVDPIKNIRIVPPHATIEASVSKKTLTLSWEEQLEANTTYAIYLNDAIKDLSEGNDSTIQYVFSTGAVLDTLSYSVSLVDAWTNKPLDNYVVALYQPMSNKLVSFSKSSKGLATLNYLRPGTYNLLAFKDENNDLNYQNYERVGFSNTGKITFSESYTDSISLRVFTPQPEPKIRTVKFIPPRSFALGANRPIENESLFFNGQPISKEKYTKIADDSLLIYIDPGEGLSGEFVLTTESFSDTTTCRISQKNRDAGVVPTLKKYKHFIQKGIAEFEFNDQIKSIPDRSEQNKYIQVTRLSDSTILGDDDFGLARSMNSLIILGFNQPPGEYEIDVKPGLIDFASGKTAEFKTTVEYKEERVFGSFEVDVSAYTYPAIVQLLSGKEILAEKSTDGTTNTLEFNHFEPGSYTFRIIHDTNQNGIWDVGNYDLLQQAERIDYYSKSSQLRANWTIKVTLEPTP